MNTIQTSQRQVVLQSLSPCSTYLVVVTAINCGLRITSEAHLLGLYDSTPFNITLCPGENFKCSDWITEDMMSKVADIESVLNSVLISQCLVRNLSCYVGSGFICSMDESMATFEYIFINMSCMVLTYMSILPIGQVLC